MHNFISSFPSPNIIARHSTVRDAKSRHKLSLRISPALVRSPILALLKLFPRVGRIRRIFLCPWMANAALWSQSREV